MTGPRFPHEPPGAYFQGFNHNFWIICIDTKRIYAIRPSLCAMSYSFKTISRTILILAVTALMLPAGLSGVQVYASICATGLSPNLHITLLVPTSNPARRALAPIIQSNLPWLWIDAARVELPFSPNIFYRALSPTDPNVL